QKETVECEISGDVVADHVALRVDAECAGLERPRRIDEGEPAVAEQKAADEPIRVLVLADDLAGRADRRRQGVQGAGVVDRSEGAATEKETVDAAGAGVTADDVPPRVDANGPGVGRPRDGQRRVDATTEQEAIPGPAPDPVVAHDLAGVIDSVGTRKGGARIANSGENAPAQKESAGIAIGKETVADDLPGVVDPEHSRLQRAGVVDDGDSSVPEQEAVARRIPIVAGDLPGRVDAPGGELGAQRERDSCVDPRSARPLAAGWMQARREEHSGKADHCRAAEQARVEPAHDGPPVPRISPARGKRHDGRPVMPALFYCPAL